MMGVHLLIYFLQLGRTDLQDPAGMWLCVVEQKNKK